MSFWSFTVCCQFRLRLGLDMGSTCITSTLAKTIITRVRVDVIAMMSPKALQHRCEGFFLGYNF